MDDIYYMSTKEVKKRKALESLPSVGYSGVKRSASERIGGRIKSVVHSAGSGIERTTKGVNNAVSAFQKNRGKGRVVKIRRLLPY